MGSLTVATMSSTSLWTMGFPATAIRGFGNRQAHAAMRFPIPAIGIMIFILSNVLQRYRSAFFRLVIAGPMDHFPVLPASGNGPFLQMVRFLPMQYRAYLAMTSCAMRSPGWNGEGLFAGFTTMTLISPGNLHQWYPDCSAW